MSSFEKEAATKKENQKNHNEFAFLFVTGKRMETEGVACSSSITTSASHCLIALAVSFDGTTREWGINHQICGEAFFDKNNVTKSIFCDKREEKK